MQANISAGEPSSPPPAAKAAPPPPYSPPREHEEEVVPPSLFVRARAVIDDCTTAVSSLTSGKSRNGRLIMPCDIAAFIREEKEAIRKIMGDSKAASSGSSSSVGSSSWSSGSPSQNDSGIHDRRKKSRGRKVGSMQRKAADRAERMANTMKEILNDYRNSQKQQKQKRLATKKPPRTGARPVQEQKPPASTGNNNGMRIDDSTDSIDSYGAFQSALDGAKNKNKRETKGNAQQQIDDNARLEEEKEELLDTFDEDILNITPSDPPCSFLSHESNDDDVSSSPAAVDFLLQTSNSDSLPGIMPSDPTASTMLTFSLTNDDTCCSASVILDDDEDNHHHEDNLLDISFDEVMPDRGLQHLRREGKPRRRQERAAIIDSGGGKSSSKSIVVHKKLHLNSSVNSSIDYNYHHYSSYREKYRQIRRLQHLRRRRSRIVAAAKASLLVILVGCYYCYYHGWDHQKEDPTSTALQCGAIVKDEFEKSLRGENMENAIATAVTTATTKIEDDAAENSLVASTVGRPSLLSFFGVMPQRSLGGEENEIVITTAASTNNKAEGSLFGMMPQELPWQCYFPFSSLIVDTTCHRLVLELESATTPFGYFMIDNSIMIY